MHTATETARLMYINIQAGNAKLVKEIYSDYIWGGRSFEFRMARIWKELDKLGIDLENRKWVIETGKDG